MKKFLIIPLLCIAFISCEKNDSKTLLLGTFTENLPINGRSNLKFLNGNILVRSELGSANTNTYNYSITATKIILTHRSKNGLDRQEFDFEIIDEHTLKVQNLYPSIPELPISYMFFKKINTVSK